MHPATALPGLFVGCLLAGCGDSPATDAAPRSVELEARRSSSELLAEREMLVVARATVEDFVFDAALGEVVDGRWRPTGDGPQSLSIPGPFDLGRIDRVALALEGQGDARWRAAFLAGKRLLATLAVQDARRTPGVVLVELPEETRGVADELLISFARYGAQLSLAEVSFLGRPPAARVPAPGEGLQPVTRARVTRPAAGLFAGTPLRGRLWLASKRDSLGFALFCAGEHGSRVGLELRDASSGATRSAEYDVRAGAGWSECDEQLAGWGPGEVRFEFSLLEGEPCAVSSPVVFERDPSAPTVLLVTSDTHRGDYLSFAGLGVELETPALEALAARGTAFLDARSTTNITNPSHVALLTGVHPREHGIVDNRTPLAGVAPTLAEVFARAGWGTLAVTSASHLAPARSGLGQGFEVFAAPQVGEAEEFDAVARLESLLAGFEGRPLFVWLHLFDAHTPYRPSERWRERYVEAGRDPRDSALPPPPRVIPWARGVRDLGYLEELYRAEVSGLDERLVRVLERPRFARGWIAFTGDHGEHLGVKDGLFDHLTLEPATLHVPLILTGPGVASGVRSRAAVTNLDLGRTLLDLAGLWGAGFPGHNLLEVGAAADAPRYAYARYGQSASVERDGWLFVRHLVDQSANGAPIDFRAGQEQLFDLEHDRDCTRDLIEERAARAAELRALLDEFLAGARPRGWGAEWVPSASELQELEALGYAGARDE